MKAGTWTALLALSACTTGAFAQKTALELYGRVDQSVGKGIGSAAKSMQNGSGNRLGVRVDEDLGGGLAAFANMEHGFNGDTGAVTDTARFWNRRVFVGLKHKTFGTLQVGRDYTSAYVAAQVRSDPFGHNFYTTMLRFATGGIGIVRYDESVKYYNGIGPVSVSAQMAESSGSINVTPDRPWSAAISYSTKPVYLAFGVDNPGGINDKWNYATGVFKLGKVDLYVGGGDGRNNSSQKVRSAMIGATVDLGPVELRAAYGQLKNRTTSVTQSQKAAIGAFYSFSTRTMLYTTFSNDSKVATEKNGYEVGLQHLF